MNLQADGASAALSVPDPRRRLGVARRRNHLTRLGSVLHPLGKRS
jgi:hypothetical protein